MSLRVVQIFIEHTLHVKSVKKCLRFWVEDNKQKLINIDIEILVYLLNVL